MALKVGDKAPDFTLKTKTAEGLKDITLSDTFGKKQILLLFVPLAFTPVCTKSFCAATDDYQDYSNYDAEVYGISIDSPFALDAWAKASKMGITLLSDMQKEAIKKYDLLDTELFGLGGVAWRSAFVINKKGELSYAWKAENPSNFPNFDEIKAALRKGMEITA